MAGGRDGALWHGRPPGSVAPSNEASAGQPHSGKIGQGNQALRLGLTQRAYAAACR
jgi:hypothetical protein